jgi:asparagine synthase (glutamine-hydrolysing)
MCGIVGIRDFSGTPVDAALVGSMTDTLQHRGPDGHGQWSAEGIAFGHRRLSIIDVEGSPQPMSSVDGRYVVCFNGEIFNYRELRSQFTYPFRTSGDTETLLALFATEGTAGLSRLRGQFAFAVYDQETRELWLVRDRLGVLPLYFYADERILAFASEPKALSPVLPRGMAIDERHLVDYLMRRAVPAPGTLLRGVRKVPPGHYVRVSPAGVVTVHQYWSLPDPADLLELPDAESIDLVSTLLTEAVRDALVADVPVGSYLSGGVDSSLMVALASGLARPLPLQTFSADFGDPRYDETAHATTVAELFGTIHHRVRVQADDFSEAWPVLTRYRDAPISEPADVAVYRLAKAAREHVKVVLSGEGSDELFGGYPKYRYAGATVRTGAVPFAVRRSLLPLVERALPHNAHRLRIAARAQSARTASDRLATWFAPFTAYECEQLLGLPVRARRDEPHSRDAIDLMGRLDLESWLPDNLLERGDRMSMAASLELRPPFLDHRLVETAFRLPSRLKVRHGQTKWIVKQVAARHLPDTIVSRPKVGFRVPLDSWFRGGLRDLAHDLLLGDGAFVQDVMDGRVVQRILDDHDRGRRNEEIRIWTLLSLEVWAREVLSSSRVTV